MKCAFILYANQLGGHELMSSELAAQFVEASHQVTLFLPNEIKNKQRLVDGHSNIRIEGYDSGINEKNKIGIKSFVVSSLKRFSFPKKSPSDRMSRICSFPSFIYL